MTGTPGWPEAPGRRHAASLRPDGATGAGAPAAVAAGMSSADLFAAYQGRIRRYILGMVHDPVEAEDLTQDVFLQAHRKLGSLQDPDAVTSWLYQIATHVCYDRFRRSSRQPRFGPLDSSGPAGAGSGGYRGDETSLDRVLERAEMTACVRSFLEDLSDEYRQVILLHDLEGLTNAEIAEMLGASLATVKIRLHRARRKLQAALAAGCDFSRDEHGVFVCERAAGPDTTARPSGQRAGAAGVSFRVARPSLMPGASPQGGAPRQQGGQIVMWWGNGSSGYGWWPLIMLMGVFMVICMVMMARMMGRAWPGPRREPERHGPDASERILDQRLASGEIDLDEYERLRDALQRPAGSARV